MKERLRVAEGGGGADEMASGSAASCLHFPMLEDALAEPLTHPNASTTCL